MVFQNAALFDSLTVAENVGYELAEHSELPEETIWQLCVTALARVGLSEDVMNLRPPQLSGGMKKRVSFARATVYDSNDITGETRAPELILLVRTVFH